MLLLTEVTDWLDLMGEAVRDLSGDETEAEVAVEEVELVLRTDIEPRLMGILEGVAGLINIFDGMCESNEAGPEDMFEGVEDSYEMSTVLLAVILWPILARDRGSLEEKYINWI